MLGWIGVDLDGTLAEYHGWNDGIIGPPIPLMVERVKRWIAESRDVRIFTARVCEIDDIPPADWPTHHLSRELVVPIQHWCLTHLGKVLPITNKKDFWMVELWDDRCVRVECNQGYPVVYVVE